jgi:hypothetical protein
LASKNVYFDTLPYMFGGGVLGIGWDTMQDPKGIKIWPLAMRAFIGLPILVLLWPVSLPTILYLKLSNDSIDVTMSLNHH